VVVAVAVNQFILQEQLVVAAVMEVIQIPVPPSRELLTPVAVVVEQVLLQVNQIQVLAATAAPVSSLLGTVHKVK
jgi:hypothetical protein